MNQKINELRAALVDAFAPLYAMNDAAHRTEHFEEVYRTGCTINTELKLGYDPRLILIVAYCHDMFTWSRHNHHTLAATFIDGTDHPLIADLSAQDRVMVAFACATHRASFQGEFHDQFGEMMNSADRGTPEGADRLVSRAYQYSLAKYPLIDNHVWRSVLHVKDKYGVGGYARYPAMYMKVFGEALAQQQREIAQLDSSTYQLVQL